MTKEKLLGTKYGIRITRPWNLMFTADEIFPEEYITEENYEVALEDLGRMQNHELNNEWPWLVKKGLVEEVDQQMVGYNK